MDKPLERREVTPIPKNTRPWVCQKGNEDCTRKDPCPSCRGRRSRREGLKKQRLAKKLVGVPDSKFRGADGNEENWKDPVLRWEVKAGAQVGAIATKYLAVEGQSNKSRATGDTRPVAFAAMPVGWGSDGLVILRLSAFREIVEAARQAQSVPSREQPQGQGPSPER